jgi:outer membrane protein assembly factor BamB
MVASLLLGALALVVVAAPADAHTPSFQVSCDKLAVNLQNYQVDTSSAGAKANQVVVTVGGLVVAAERFGESYVKTFNLPAHDVALPVKVGVIAWDAPASARLSPTWTAVSQPCNGPVSAEELSFTQIQGCESAILNLSSLGREAEAIVTRNGEKIWSGTTGADGAPVGTGALAAKAGDVFEVARAHGDELKGVGEFTYALPETCAPAGALADLDFAKTVSCEDVTVKLENVTKSGREKVEAMVLRNGEQAWAGTLGATAVTGALPAKAGDVFDVAYLAGNQRIHAGQFTYDLPDVCGAVPAVPAAPGAGGLDLPAEELPGGLDLDLAKNLSCEGAVLTLTNAGESAKAVVTQNGEQVWSGTVGGAVSSADTGNLPAKAGDVFAVRYLTGAAGAKTDEISKFTYDVPAACGLLSSLPAVTPDLAPAVTPDLATAATPELTCEGVLYQLENKGALVKAVVTRNGETLWSNALGGKVDSLSTGTLPAKAGDVFAVGYLPALTDKLPVNLGEKVTFVEDKACAAAGRAPVFAEQVDCADANGVLTSKGPEAEAVMFRNGKQVWDGVVGGATPQVPIQGIPAGVGDVFTLKVAGETVEKFTYEVPVSCQLPDAVPAADFADTCEGVTAKLTNPGDKAIELLVQARASAENAWANVGEPVSVPAGTSLAEAKKVAVPTSLDGTEVRTIVNDGNLQVGGIHSWAKKATCAPATLPGAGELGIDVARDCQDLIVTLPNTASAQAEKVEFTIEHTSEAAREYVVLPGTTSTYTTPLAAGERIVVSLGDKVQEIDLTPGEECTAAAPAEVTPVDAGSEAPGVQGVTVDRGGLPVTGSSLSAVIGVAAALLASGAFLALIARRRSVGTPTV